VRENRERKIVDEELDTCRCFSKNLEWVVSNRETLIELLSQCVKKRGISRRLGVGIGCESNSPIAIDRGSKGERKGAVGLLKHSGHDVRQGSSHDERIVREGWGGTGGKKRCCAAGRGGGHLGTLLLLDAATCAAVPFFLPLLPFLVTCAQVCSWGCGGSETVKPGGDQYGRVRWLGNLRVKFRLL